MPIGSHAFLAYANRLGVRWHNPEQTSDIDFARVGRNVSIALPATIQAQPHSALLTMEGGSLPLVQHRDSAGVLYKHREEPELRVDVLTTRTSDSEEPIHIDNLDVALQPLQFMELSLEGVGEGGAGACADAGAV